MNNGMGMGMGMGSSNSTSMMDMMMMTPFLHFTGGDFLIFKAWMPSSAGAIAGASIGLACLAVIDRWLAAVRATLDAYWTRRALRSTSQNDCHGGSCAAIEPSINSLEKVGEIPAQVTIRTVVLHTVPPFIPSHDIPRGVIHGIQALVAYLLMIGVMTYQAAYLISIVVGLGLGEIIFGRYGCGQRVNAHFQLQAPAPRGAFDEDNEPKFCDGYINPTNNRTLFPLSGGFLSLNSEHPQWTIGVFLASGPANTFNDFKQIKPYSTQKGEGIIPCIPLDFTSPNATGLNNGQNVTIQIVFDGGDGQLYQCADLTLSNNATLSGVGKCTNTTGTGSNGGSTSTTTGSAAQSTKTSSSAERSSLLGLSTSVLGLVGLAMGLSF
ncbi:hypothetical protein AX17_000852 [Amanita inopinata Kibby_2008]|nr:hypothetical protein AX17_000852 [Amanita inopinata Kibby_2008]